MHFPVEASKKKYSNDKCCVVLIRSLYTSQETTTEKETKPAPQFHLSFTLCSHIKRISIFQRWIDWLEIQSRFGKDKSWISFRFIKFCFSDEILLIGIVIYFNGKKSKKNPVRNISDWAGYAVCSRHRSMNNTKSYGNGIERILDICSFDVY